ncbi:hypothetical protein NQ315_002323 [Exocentrus adspersus]|uniref:Glucose-methanol-choline oxidoreductase N-terminal domain-containing protein n=1 Tax=Exocentrus adspersus TaxID=1586481 RepID=A0AAV8VT83_9CUCU|nr:hypothetical protein NQ315_002323 [Exocentrus adspersus]
MQVNVLLAVLCLLRNANSQVVPTPPGLIPTFITAWNELSKTLARVIQVPNFNEWFASHDFQPQPEKRYDFIIVGSGSSGSVLANRLSENPNWKILLLEAGEPETGFMAIPPYQPNVATGLEDQRMAWPRGRALGGTSVINYMIYTRGNRWDYDTWAAKGNPGWSYDEVLPYYIKSERARLNQGDYRYHGTDGYLSVEDTYQSPLVQAFTEGGKELGLEVWDYNTPTSSYGVSTIQATARRGRRHSGATAFLWPVRDRPNLDIVTSAYVTKVLIDQSTRQAFGVQYDRRGSRHKVLAKKEVILSAGTFNSPQLLMLSGIGPRHHLESLGIPCFQDLPVGGNLQDHVAFVGLSFLIDAPISLSLERFVEGISLLANNGTGPLTSLGGVEGIGYIKTGVSKTVRDQPDIELLFVGGTLASDYGLFTRRGMRIRDDVYDSIFQPLHNQHHWTVFPMLLHPKSVGHLELRSRNPYHRPLLYGNYFTDPYNEDLRTLLAAIRVVQRLSDTAAFQRYGSRLNPRPMSGCTHLVFDSDEYWECALRSLSVTLHHQVGTAKMGPADDPGAVVNAQLQVYGVGGCGWRIAASYRTRWGRTPTPPPSWWGRRRRTSSRSTGKGREGRDK